MKKTFLLFAFAAISIFINKSFAQMVGQPTTFNFSKMDCNGTMADCFADLDAGKIVILHLHHSCSACPPPAQKMQAMANNILANHPGTIKAYAFATDDLLSCSGSQTWVSSNNLMLYAPMDSGAAITAYYGTGMPKVIVLAGKDHRIVYNSAAFSTSDTTMIRDSILNRLGFGANGIFDVVNPISNLSVFPNPSANQFTVSGYKFSENATIKVYDLVGKEMIEQKIINQKSEIISTKNLPNGIYLLKVSANGIIAEQKITVAH
jgi:Secretion system C-terminal sorting domain